MSPPSPYRAAALSLLVPGLGQLSNGERAKGAALLCIAIGIMVGILLATIGPAMFHSGLTILVLGLVSPFVWIPAIIDAYQQAAGAARPVLSGQKTWYVVLMLLTVGPMALPLLWQNARFSRRAKWVWTLAVIGFALAGILLLIVVAPMLQRSQPLFLDPGALFP